MDRIIILYAKTNIMLQMKAKKF